MIEAIELTKRYEDDFLALDRFTLKVAEGETFVLLGANGAGKTTAINLFLNFIDPSGGTARINGIDVVKEPLKAKEHVAFIPENVSLYPTLTARQNLDYFTRLGGGPRLSKGEYDDLLSKVGLGEERFDHRVGKFSKGMRQKLGIAIALARRSSAVFLDEPTSGLDPEAVSELMALLCDLREQGCAVLMASHDVFRARQVADRVGIMKEGRLVGTWEHQELARIELESLYLETIRSS